jgi:hypothetical protein
MQLKNPEIEELIMRSDEEADLASISKTMLAVTLKEYLSKMTKTPKVFTGMES